MEAAYAPLLTGHPALNEVWIAPRLRPAEFFSGSNPGALRRLVILFCLVYFIGNLAIPGAVLLGKLRPHEPARLAATR